MCQRPLDGAADDGRSLCAPCLANPPRHDGITAGTLYNDASRQLVLALKHGRKIALAPMMARLIAARLPLLKGEWVAIPVPLHRRRLWHRGFNQSALLARELAKLSGLQILVDGLVRTRATPPLGGLGRKDRSAALGGAIAVRASRGERIAGAQMLLVDDVMTSGATSDACARALRQAGAARVRIACFARVLDESL